jgi:transcriptional regulator with XRE-family HTH domain
MPQRSRRSALCPGRLVPGVPKAAATSAIIARILRNYRSQMDVSQERLARLARVDRTYVGKVERGNVNPTIYLMNRLLRAIGVTWKDFGETLDRELGTSESRGAGRARRPPGHRAP